MTSIATKFGTTLAALALTCLYATQPANAHPRGHGQSETLNDADQNNQDSDAALISKQLAALKEYPGDATVAAAYARSAAKRARRLGDTPLLRHAEYALSPWQDDQTAPTEILIIRANIKQINHNFDEALDDLGMVLERQPAHPQARLSRAFIFATTGRAASGRNDCSALQPNTPIAIRETCIARVSSLTGDLETAHARMQTVLAITSTEQSEARIFALGVAAEIAERIGHIDTAKEHYNELITLDPQSVFARAAYAEHLLTHGEAGEARHIIGDSPNTEALLLLRVLAADEPNDPDSDRAASELQNRMTSDATNNDPSHAREYARFALDHMNDAPLAIRHAQENWRVQKEPIDAQILARAAIANADDAIIDLLRRWQDQTGLEDNNLTALLNSPQNPG